MQGHKGPLRDWRQELRQAGLTWWLVVVIGALAGVVGTGVLLRAIGFGQP